MFTDFFKDATFKPAHAITPVYLFKLFNQSGLTVYVTNYGARLVGIFAPSKNGKFKDIILGYPALNTYITDPFYMGAAIGRYANRIAYGKFNLNNQTFQLTINSGKHHLHGGWQGFHNVVWNVVESSDSHVVMEHFSPAGSENYPGNLRTRRLFSLSDNNDLQVQFKAETDQSTPINFTMHPYFNLTGAGSVTCLQHLLYINADTYIPVSSKLIPIGTPEVVSGTPFDFTKEKKIGKEINAFNSQLKFGNGYDHSFVLNTQCNSNVLAARVVDSVSGRVLELFTNQPALQLYTGNFLNNQVVGKGNHIYNKHSAFCLEPQKYPNSPNEPDFPDTVIHPNQEYEWLCRYRFSVM